MRARAVLLAACLVCARTSWAQTPDAPSPTSSSAAPGETSFLVENMTRGELWRYFQPPPNAATHPDYSFIGSRFTLGATYRGSRWSADGVLQYVRVENLPAGAIGPGLLGNGGAYYFQANGRFSYQFYLRRLTLGWRDARSGAWIEGGRFSRAAAAERPSGDAIVDRLVSDDLNGRLLGDAEWSFYQRAFDGARGGVNRGGLSATLTAAVPTQGTFEESANLPMDRVRVAALELSAAPGRVVPHTRLDLFALGYDDERRVSIRPDNSGLGTTAADVRVWTLGASSAGAYPSRLGTSDVVGWIAGQTGDWYGLPHRGLAATGAAGHRFTRVPLRPWLRAGVAWASGDDNGSDGRHQTFFPMLPSSDRVSKLNVYALMNVMDRWATLELTPHRTLDLTAGVHHATLASSADRWYQGTGATLRAGNYFGFQGRTSRGGETIGTIVEGTAAWRVRRWWTLRGYVGRMDGGDVVERTFRSRRLVSGWLESTLRF